MDTAMNINQEKLNGSIRYLNKMGDMTVESLREAAPEVSERLDRLGELLKDEEFCKQFLTSESKASAAKLFADRGFDITDEELTALATQTRDLVCQLIENGGELSEEDLEQVAGGVTWEDVTKMSLTVSGVGGLLGTMVAPGLGTVMGIGLGAATGLVISGVCWMVSSLTDWLFD